MYHQLKLIENKTELQTYLFTYRNDEQKKCEKNFMKIPDQNKTV